ncbi:MAG: anthranilate synthase component I [Dehalococcoidia bacterium]
MYYPDINEVKRLSEKGNMVPIFREISADLLTPVSAYLKVARPPYSFLFESVEGGEHMARYSFIGTEPEEVIKTGVGQKNGPTDPLIHIEEMLAKYTIPDTSYIEKFCGGAVGYISYDAVGHFENLPSPKNDTLNLPESIFFLTQTFLVFDHLRHKIRVVSHAHIKNDIEQAYTDATKKIDDLVSRLEAPLELPYIAKADVPDFDRNPQSNVSREYFEHMVNTVKEYIVAGDAIQVVPSQRLARPTNAHPFEIYRALRTINPSPYMYYLDLDGFNIVGASPEMLVQVQDGFVRNNPIAGTRPRGSTDAQDIALENELKNDEKELAEHIMLVDLGRNDVGRVSVPGTVEVSTLLDVVRYSHVMHLVSEVVGKLQPDKCNYDAFRACFPTGTVSGAPKIRAMEIIAELEPVKRGPYSGGVGYFDFAGNMDTAIAIRTLVIKDGVAYAQAGGGVVFDSKPDLEFEETIHKMSALLRAVDLAEE